MKVGEFEFKRRYSAAQIVIDIASAGALLYLAYIIYVCAAEIEQLKEMNKTDADMSMFDWRPLLVWAGIGVLLFAVSFFMVFRNKKMPKKLCVTQNNAVKYCNIIDTCISCVRLMLIISLCEMCYLHMAAILMRDVGFSTQLLLDMLIIAGIIVLTRMRLTAVSETELENMENGHKRKEIVED